MTTNISTPLPDVNLKRSATISVDTQGTGAVVTEIAITYEAEREVDFTVGNPILLGISA